MTTKQILYIVGFVVASMGFFSCENNRSYAELLNDERQSCNAFLCNFRLADVPADSVFEVGENAPFYKLDPDGNVYMQLWIFCTANTPKFWWTAKCKCNMPSISNCATSNSPSTNSLEKM